ncbi:uncharacterized protein LOC103113127 [Erinaceus europaeus]|uniref:Uncharacterized protein LOC103113127 n=1 Tax=Erinaceus europaeus TaxID=9365 RepID=A0A1S2ZPT5_ERIEU|nr:uncharacterized protein LOC103113127 [Erinaceus europaeus]
MSGRQVNRANTYSCSNHPNSSSFPLRTTGCSHHPNVTGVSSLKYPRTTSALEFSSYDSPRSPSLVRRICMGRPYNAKCVETSHLAKRPKEIRKPAANHGNPCCLLCTDRPSGPSSPTFLDQLIKSINYLDRSTSTFYNKSSLSLPRLAANYLERATNSIQLDHPDRAHSRSYSIPNASPATSDMSNVSTNTSTCMVPSTRGVGTLQYTDNSVYRGPSHRYYSPNTSPTMPRRPGVKLPELPLFGSGIFALGRLPKVWEAIRSGWRAPEPISKPSSWW